MKPSITSTGAALATGAALLFAAGASGASPAHHRAAGACAGRSAVALHLSRVSGPAGQAQLAGHWRLADIPRRALGADGGTDDGPLADPSHHAGAPRALHRPGSLPGPLACLHEHPARGAALPHAGERPQGPCRLLHLHGSGAGLEGRQARRRARRRLQGDPRRRRRGADETAALRGSPQRAAHRARPGDRRRHPGTPRRARSHPELSAHRVLTGSAPGVPGGLADVATSARTGATVSWMPRSRGHADRPATASIATARSSGRAPPPRCDSTA